MRTLIFLDSILDTRLVIEEAYNGTQPKNWESRTKDRYREEYLTRDVRILYKAKSTRIDKLLVYLHTMLKSYEVDVEQRSEKDEVFVNVFPYSGFDTTGLQKVLAKKFHIYGTVVIINENPSIPRYKSMDLIIDYDALIHLELALSEIKREETMQAISGMEETMLVTPMSTNAIPTLEDDGRDFLSMMDSLMKEYTPVVRLEVVDVAFFNKE